MIELANRVEAIASDLQNNLTAEERLTLTTAVGKLALAPEMNPLLVDIIERDSNSAATWFKKPDNGPARAFQDRRWLLNQLLPLIAPHNGGPAS